MIRWRSRVEPVETEEVSAFHSVFFELCGDQRIPAIHVRRATKISKQPEARARDSKTPGRGISRRSNPSLTLRAGTADSLTA